ncbi:murein transglycosylase A [Loktanella sp. S4079]|uniref:murein transglycosylase A n=1 Tax=Loktanella sp. S4079 TaxID=579483 RepID=UPI0005FA4B34|nr:MltA domain-containing protein [Loktanella sp. S4079]KJZ19422.1 murein transglycosylase [Loktanella sp. S4079]
MAELAYRRLSYDALTNWAADDHQAALDVFLTTATDFADQDWRALSAHYQTARSFFETNFTPVLIEDGSPCLFTGYYEPEITGSREPTDTFCVPIYALPEDPSAFTRKQIDHDQALAGHGLEIAYLADPVDLFFLQVQGSGRIVLSDGHKMRVGFAGKNGRAYTSIGKLLIARSALSAEEISPETIRAWIKRNGDAGRRLLWENESYVFFRELTQVAADQGPIGTLGKSITPLRSIAVDPDRIPLGAPVWIENAKMTQLMVAQDTGSAIKGSQRADIFFGTGQTAGERAGDVNETGRMVVLLPNAMADKLCGRGH